MFNRKKLVTLGIAGTAALALVGVGTGAQWADQVDAVEQISTGTVDLQVTGFYNSYPGDHTTPVIAPDGSSITFTVPLEDAYFDYVQDVFVKNVGSLPLKHAWYEVDVQGDPELTDHVLVNLNDTRDPSDAGHGWATGLDGYTSPGYAMPAGASTTLFFDFSTGGGFLPDDAQGKTMTVTLTFHGIDGDGGTPMLETPESR